MAKLNYDPRPPERRLESDPVERELDRADKMAEGLIAFGQLAMVAGVTIFAIVLLVSLL